MTQKNTLTVGIEWYAFLETTSIAFIVSLIVILFIFVNALFSEPTMTDADELNIIRRECVLRGLGEYDVDENGKTTFILNDGNGREGAIDYQKEWKELSGTSPSKAK